MGRSSGKPSLGTHDLDDLINYSIQRARRMGYDLQALRLRVRERLLAEPPDHLLVVEQEPGLREIVRRELQNALGWTTRGCSYSEFLQEPGLAIGAQVLIANHLVEAMKPLVPSNRPALGIVYSLAAEHVDLIERLEEPSIVSIVSGSEGLLRTAKSLFAPAIRKRHVLKEVLVLDGLVPDLNESDLAFCDTLTVDKVQARRKIHYPLIARTCLANLAASLDHEDAIGLKDDEREA